MELLFLGTGAADYNWDAYGADGILGSTATLLDDHILLDCGPTVPAALERFGVAPEDINVIVNTHRHDDHFLSEKVRQIAGGRNVDFYGSPQACRLVADCCRVHELTWGDEFSVGNHRFLTLPSNHALEDLREETFNYLISDGSKTLLYALDTSWMTTRARHLIGTRHIDGIVWDATTSKPDILRFEHSDPEIFAAVRKMLEWSGNIDKDVKVWFDHRGRNFWPATAEEQEEVARRVNAMLAHDGEKVSI